MIGGIAAYANMGKVLSSSPSGGGAWTLIDSIVLSSAQAAMTFSGIPGTYNHLKVIGDLLSSAGAFIKLNLNADSGSNYNFQTLTAFGTTKGTALSTAQTQIEATASIGDAAVDLTLPCYANALAKQGVLELNSAVLSNYFISHQAFQWGSSAAIDEIAFALSAGNYSAGSALYLYGIE